MESATASDLPDQPPVGGVTEVQPRSYLESVVGSGSNTAPFMIANDSSNDILGEEEEADPLVLDDDPTCPTIRLTDQEKERIREPWRKSLIIKVVGRKVGYAYLLWRLNTMWKPKIRMELIALENDYFFVKFGSVEDLEFAMFEGPWMVLDHYLIVKQWVPNFDPLTDTTEKVLVWIRFPNLPVEYYNILTLRKIGNKLGWTVRVDHTTSLVSRGKFARVYVEIDLTRPLISRFTLEEKVWQVAYEGMHLVCFSCGLYGHRREICPTHPHTATETEVPRHDDAGAQGPGRASSADGGILQQNLSKHTSAPYGSWIIVTRKERRPKGR
ncbi:uncharacterized protein LOC115997607 [Ipomoea triloba]|uniref:uncharacterized protein LOC115997607 n=1 Tax=Ipomoea triloba TaxID=35885 RepID=UPI00125DB2F4|nr:uncharacterized protein LOC115997607 [Ipomoea triloba]